MISHVTCFALTGLEGVPVTVETDVNKGVPAFEMVGLPDAAVKESKERVRSALKNSGFSFPVVKVTVNLAPADLKKEGASFDLAVAVGLLKASEQLVGADLSQIVFLGELSLDGSLRPVRGLLPILISAKARGFTTFVIPSENAGEARFLDGVTVYPFSSLMDVVKYLVGAEHPVPVKPVKYVPGGRGESSSDLKFVKGQPMARRAVEIAVAGGHNLLLVGPPGTGKTMIARCIPTIMPDLSFGEALEITKIHSVAGILGEEGIVTERPFRTPHHTATTVSMCGGGNRVVHPGEISLAHGGVLFLDELPEYKRSTLEALRQPLEDGKITISRSGGSCTYPARFMLCASMNPCPCGNYGSEKLTCTCTPAEIRSYRRKVSGPLLDRIDLQVDRLRRSHGRRGAGKFRLRPRARERGKAHPEQPLRGKRSPHQCGDGGAGTEGILRSFARVRPHSARRVRAHAALGAGKGAHHQGGAHHRRSRPERGDHAPPYV